MSKINTGLAEYGMATKANTMKYQAASGLEVDDIIGPNTWNILING